MGKKGRRQRNGDGGSGGTTATAGNFRGTTAGLEDVVFTHGTPKDAAVFEEVVKKLARHLGQQPWKEVSVLVTALQTLEEPVFVRPEEPKREYWTSDAQDEKTTEHKVGGTLLKPVDDPALYAAKYQAYVEDRKTYKAESSAWRENRTRAYMLFTAH